MVKLFSRANTTTAKQTLRLFWREIRHDKKAFLTYVTLIPINRALYTVLLPLIFSLVIQSLLVHPHDVTPALVLLGIGAIVSIAALITADIGFRKLFAHEETMRTSLNEKAMQGLLQHSDQFFANQKIGSLAGDANTFSHSIVGFLDIIFLQASGIVANFVFSLIIIAFLSPILLIPLGAITGLLIWRSLKGTAKRGPLRHERKVLTSKLFGTIADILGNQTIVRYFATSKKEIAEVMRQRRAIESITYQEIDILQKESMIRQGTLFAFQLLTLLICVFLFKNGSVSIAALIFAVTYLGRLTSSLFDISPIIRGMEQSFLDAATITEILEVAPEITDAANASPLRVKDATIEFDAVSFAYNDNDKSVITNLDLKILPGQRIGLVGHSGGGKTTLTKLLLRFADPTSGAISIDSQPINSVTQDSLHEAISYVPQEAYLFHRSLRENVAYGLTASDEQVWKAIKQANAEDFIKDLPHGLDTIVGERGIKLSGGQRQRIALGRAILKNAPILVLDEATSALDSTSEKMIQAALTGLMKNRTSIVIAHRLSTIAQLDRIIVLEAGRIIEDGTHAELLKRDGLYAKLWQHQTGGFIQE